jgi:PAS domain S-box-containing protein
MPGLPYEQRGAKNDIAQRLAAIVESSDDAILTKDLNGTVTSWNRGAERLFGYRATEIIGKPIMLLLPDDRQDEEAPILARLRRGERVRHYETVRRRKDGSPIHISLSVSPLRDAIGRVIGASTIARDITERKQAEERQRLLMREMDHRMKNLFALAGSLVGMSVRDAATPQELASIVQERLSALARAHALTMRKDSAGGGNDSVRLHVLLRTILAPYEGVGGGDGRLQINGDDVILPGNALTAIALILHELATNAAKYGALSSPSGTVTVECLANKDTLSLIWDERGSTGTDAPGEEGFGSLLGRLASGQLGGSIEREWRPEGLRVTLTVLRDRLL